MQPRELIRFLETAAKLKQTYRHNVNPDGSAESVAEHSWRVCLMAMLIKEEFPGLDMDKVLRMCVVHDLGETVTGDIPTFEKTEKDEEEELNKLRGLLCSLSAETKQEWLELFEEMDAQKTPEARLYKALDRLEALMAHNEAPLSSWLPLEYDLQMTYGQENVTFSPYLTRWREEVRQDSIRKIESGK